MTLRFQLGWLFYLSHSFHIGSSGSVTFPSVTPGTYVVRVVSQNSKHDRAVLRRKVVVPSGPTACAVHLINRGVTHALGNVTVEFTGSGPITKFMCQLDGRNSYICKHT